MNTTDINTTAVGKEDNGMSLIRRRGRFSTFLLVFVLTALCLCCFFGKWMAGLVSSSSSDGLYASVTALGQDGSVYSATKKQNGYTLLRVDQDGEKKSFKLDSDGLKNGAVVSDLYVLSDGRIIVSYYTKSDGETLGELVIEAFGSDGKDASKLYSESCESYTPANPEKQRQTLKCYAFSENGGKLYYVIRSGVEYTAYGWAYGESGAAPAIVMSCGLSGVYYDAIVDCTYENGDEVTVILAGASGELTFIRGGEVRFGKLSDRIVDHFMQGEDGIYYIDSQNNSLNLLHYEYDTPVEDDDNGEFMIKFPDQLPVTFNDVLYVPVRFVAEALGLEVVHNADSLCTTIDNRMFLYVGSDHAVINGENVTLEDRIYLISDRTMVSKTFIETYLNCTVIRQDGEWYLVPFKLSVDDTPVVKTWDEKVSPTDSRLAYNSQFALTFDRLWVFELNRYGRSLLISHDGRVVLAGDSNADLTDQFVISGARGIAIICVIAVGAIFFAALVTYLARDYGRRFIPLSLRCTLLVFVCSVIVLNGLVIYFIEPSYRGKLLDAAKSEAVTAAKLDGQENNGEYSVNLDTIPGYIVYEKVYDEYIVSRSNMGVESGTPASTAGGFRHAGTSLENSGDPDSSDGILYDCSQIAYSRYGYGAMAVYIDTTELDAAASALFSTVYQIMNLSILAVALIVWLILYRVQKGLWIINRGVDLVATGKLGVDVVCETGDELETLAVSFNGAVGYIRSTYGRLKALSDAYRRFVPEQLVKLLGEESIENLTKKSHTTHEMVAMVVWFSFSDDRYEHDTSRLFDNINGVIERTSSIVSKNGGAVYNFAYDGFDAVFDGDPEKAVSVAIAIAQETAAMNAQRSAGDCSIRLCVTLDRGSVMMGIIGDETRMAPTAISSSLTTARHLTGIAKMTDSSILCTENLAGMIKNCRSRYIGKTLDGGSMIRMYEIYDGDALQMRQSKDMHLQTFTEAIFAFYSCDFTRAKELFMSILKHQTDDGVARHYLYLADKYSSESPKELYIGSADDGKGR